MDYHGTDCRGPGRLRESALDAEESQRNPASLALQVTLCFIQEVLPPEARILEVGCGRGGLAARLAGCGHQVVAIDHSEKIIESRAAALRLDVRRAEFFDFVEEGRLMVTSLGRSFTLLQQSGFPYLFRHFCDWLPPDESGYRLATEILAIEENLIREDVIAPLGLRIVAVKPRDVT